MNGHMGDGNIPRKGDRMSQNEMIADFLKSGKSINPMIALKKFGCFRLSARIADLKGKGMDIKSSLVNDVNGEGNPVRYAVYWLGGSNDKQ